MEFLGGVIATLIIGGLFHLLDKRATRKEVASLRQDNPSLRKDISTLPGRLIDLLVERGAIPRDREPLARRAGEDFYTIEHYLRTSYPAGRILAQRGDPPEGFKFPPTGLRD